ncbi:HAD hydrolase family protein [Candidatus Parcubacteria bacterium]|nr:HAD hydrolase family protein [Candidatus Parcubacteria bacterium]MBI4385628.1 HAD hydrolase family protein [Candidatus Parcubacteria bacterium]
MNQELREKVVAMKLFAMDFDGIHTDGRVITDAVGREYVICSRIDGRGISRLQKETDVEACVISLEANPVVAARCRKLGLPCHQGIESGEGKLAVLKRVMEERGIAPSAVLYLGDDDSDIAPMRYAGIRVTVPDAYPAVRSIAHYVTAARGGHGAVREVCELILAAKGARLSQSYE